MTIQKNSHDAQSIIAHWKTFLGKPRTELPWLNGTTAGFPNRVNGFYDCALAFSYFSGLRPVQVSCTAIKKLAIANNVWNIDPTKVIPGDAVLFDWETAKWVGKNTNTDHIGMVVSIDLKKQTVTYISADTGKVIPGIVTLNTVSFKWVAGWARLVEFAEPASVVPTVNQAQRDAHSVSTETVVPPVGVVPLVTTAAANAATATQGATASVAE